MDRRTFNKKTLAVAAGTLLAGTGISGCAFLGQEKFGRLPEGDRLMTITRSPNYRDGIFHNREPFPSVTKGGFFSTFFKFLTHPRENPEPSGPVPTVKTDLRNLDRNRDVVVWLGHSSYFMQLGGRTILVDPVFSAYASPVFFSTRAFAGTNPYTAEDMPRIDYLLVSHDHWDHLDYDTVTALKSRTGRVVTGLGVGEHFARWGFAADMVHEMDWDGTLRPNDGADGLVIHFLTARHFSGRWLTRNKSLWGGFALETPSRRVFYSGDSGYGSHFAELGKRFSGFDLALLDSGQYSEDWPYVHMNPEQAAQAAADLGCASRDAVAHGQVQHLLPFVGRAVPALHGREPWQVVSPGHSKDRRGRGLGRCGAVPLPAGGRCENVKAGRSFRTGPPDFPLKTRPRKGGALFCFAPGLGAAGHLLAHVLPGGVFGEHGFRQGGQHLFVKAQRDGEGQLVRLHVDPGRRVEPADHGLFEPLLLVVQRPGDHVGAACTKGGRPRSPRRPW